MEQIVQPAMQLCFTQNGMVVYVEDKPDKPDDPDNPDKPDDEPALDDEIMFLQKCAQESSSTV